MKNQLLFLPDTHSKEKVPTNWEALFENLKEKEENQQMTITGMEIPEEIAPAHPAFIPDERTLYRNARPFRLNVYRSETGTRTNPF